MSLTLTRRYNVGRFGYLIPHSYGNLPMVGAVATYRPGEGRFGGAVAVEGGTTNIVPSNRLKFEGWMTLGGAQVTLTQNVEFPEIGRNDATRIRTTGGTNTLKYYTSIERSIADQAYTGSVYIKNIGSKPVRFYTQFGSPVTVNPGEWTRAIVSGIGNDKNEFQLRFQTLNVDDDLDFIAWGPQAEYKLFATSFVDGTRAAGRLVYPTSVFNPAQGTISMWVRKYQLIDYNARVFWSETGSYRFGIHDFPNGSLTWAYATAGGQISGGFLTPGTWHHLVMTWHRDEGWMRGYLDGEPVVSQTFDPGTDPGFVYSDTWGLGVREDGALAFNGLFDELLILPYAASEEEIVSWYEAQGSLPPHPQASLQWDREAVRPAQMVKL